MPSFGRRQWLSCLALCALPALSLAAGTAAEGRHLATEGSISFAYILQILLSFIVVIAFIFGFAWLMRRSGRFGGGVGGRGLRVVSSLSLGMREKIVVINVGDKNIVVGVAPGQIRTLHVMDGDGGPPEAPAIGKGGGFGPLLGRFMKQ
jgi:flagellar protein FliO/FliZ